MLKIYAFVCVLCTRVFVREAYELITIEHSERKNAAMMCLYCNHFNYMESQRYLLSHSRCVHCFANYDEMTCLLCAIICYFLYPNCYANKFNYFSNKIIRFCIKITKSLYCCLYMASGSSVLI